MNSLRDKYQLVVGLEVHAQLSTKSKAYCGDSTTYGSAPNSQTSPVTLGHPGTLPKSNKKVIEYAIKMGLACQSKITERNEYARKNYFYPDLPKGYQITQDTTPICTGGIITIKNEDGVERDINITRIHMEEDAGKSTHDIDPFNTLVDLNRAGVALIEVVSEPDLRTADEAYQYLIEVRKLVRYLDICDGNLEEGSLRCDANISVMLKGSTTYGDRVEVKNMNSLRNVKKAIEFERDRQIELIENGKIVEQQTRSFNAADGSTTLMRSKENANDYRYFPEPDLQPVILSQEYIQSIRENLPLLPKELTAKFKKDFGLSEYDTNILVEDKDMAHYFIELCEHTNSYKTAANIVIGSVKSYLNEKAIEIADFAVNPKKIGQLIKLIEDGKVSNSVATQKIFPALIDSKLSPEEIVKSNNWIQESDSDSLSTYIDQALAKFPEKVEEYKAGKKGLIGLFMGEVMKLSKGKADPKLTNKMLQEILNK
ncbi:Asp-tRNA(Asn)/Glu-tRNA(Gln) amidotransferase subunit GatB [Flavobacteriales bacterium]|nr:Asp-tRNA(Asn)/Glu-tRNA(Gln) amidotransferase subunit GatB [Flavobacteriales bacterium]